MTRTILSGFAIVALLAGATTPAVSQTKPKKEPQKITVCKQPAGQPGAPCVSAGSGAAARKGVKSPTPSGNRSKYYKMKLEDALIVPVSPQASKHKGEIEIESFSPGASPSAGPSKKRRLQAR